MTYIIDAHQDIAYNAFTLGRDFRLSAHEIRRMEAGTNIPAWNNGEATLGWQDYQRGKIALIFTTLFFAPRKYNGGDYEIHTYSNPKEARPLFRAQLDYYHSLTEDGEKYQLVKNQVDLSRVLEPWKQDLPGDHPVGLILLLEGAEALGDPRELEEYYAEGLRMVGPVWSGIRYMGGTNEDRPFDHEARRLLEIMASLNMILDISHMTERASLTSLDLYEGPVMAGHGNCRAVNGGQGGERHFTDATLRRLLDRDGVMGVLPYNKFLVSEWNSNLPRESVTLDNVIRHIDHVCQLAGDSKHVAIGSDFDGGFGFPRIPLEIDTIADFQKLAPALKERGYTGQDVENIFHQNWFNLLERSLPG
jgi:membrane dipeptidase